KKEIERVRLVLTEEDPDTGEHLWSVIFPDEKTILSQDAHFFWAAGTGSNDWIGESVVEQTRMTQANIEYLVSPENIMHEDNLGNRSLPLIVGASPSALSHIRKYLKYAEEFARSHATWENDAEDVADVCRPNLTVEIECESGLEVTHAYPLLVPGVVQSRYAKYKGEGITGWLGKNLTGEIRFVRQGDSWSYEPFNTQAIEGLEQRSLETFLSLVGIWAIAEDLPKHITEFSVIITTDITRLHETAPKLKSNAPYIATTNKDQYIIYFHPWAIELANTKGKEVLVDDFITHELGELTQNHQQVCDNRFAFYRDNPKRLMQLLEVIQKDNLELDENYLDGLLSVALETNCFIQVAGKMLGITPRQLARVFLGYAPSSKKKLDNPLVRIRLQDVRPDVSKRKVLLKLNKALEIFQARYPGKLAGATHSMDGSGMWILYFSNLRLYPQGTLCTAATAYLTMRNNTIWHLDEAEVLVSDVDEGQARGEIEDLIRVLKDTDYVGTGEVIYSVTIAVSWWVPIAVLILTAISSIFGLAYWLVRPVSQKTAERVAVAIRSMGHTPGTLVMDDLRDAYNALAHLDEELWLLPAVMRARKNLVTLVGLPALHTSIDPATGKKYQKSSRLHRLWDEVREVSEKRQPTRYEIAKWFLILMLSKYEINREKRRIRALLLQEKAAAGSEQRALLRRAYALIKRAGNILSNRLKLFLGKQKPEVVDLNTFLKLIRQAVAYKFGDELEIEVCDGVQQCMVVIPGNLELKNAIANCIENASKAIFKTLTLTELASMEISTQLSFDRERMKIVVRRSGDSLSVSVMDRGVGIEPKKTKRGVDGRYPICRLNVSSEGEGHGVGMTEIELAVGRENLGISSLTIEALVNKGLLPVRKEILEEVSHRSYLFPALRIFIRDLHITLQHLSQAHTHNIGAIEQIGGIEGNVEVKNLPRNILKFRQFMGKILGGMRAHLDSLEVVDEAQPVLSQYVLN
ncbi:MAG: hypothetical protein PHY94_08205, partial [Candidatus Omnitrophica bacterium]|nr:hypothetical protein [Candidatus Omnitrophota bacterium]